ncbi:hypothetical protein ACFWDK_15215 [Micromonospora chalcea]
MWDLAIRPAVEAAGLEAWDGQEERLGSNIVHRDISHLLWHSRLIIAELTGRNPNVMYELGMAHAAKKPVILLLEREEVPPFDVTHIRYLRYDRFNLHALRTDLISRIRSTLALPDGQRPDLFPELEVVTQELRDRLSYLTRRLVPVQVNLRPRCADLFLNDKLVGSGPAVIRVNPDAHRTTLSASTVGFFEFHGEIGERELTEGVVDIELEKVHLPGVDVSSRLAKRVPRWLRDRRRDPHNPVLMRAISSYLMAINERDDAIEEIEDLLDVAPTWFMSINQLGFYYGMAGDTNEALPLYAQVVLMKPDHFIGYFNLACVHALRGDFEAAIDQLARIADNDAARSSVRETLDALHHDPDFAELVDDPAWRARFREIEQVLFPDVSEHDWGRRRDGGYYTF